MYVDLSFLDFIRQSYRICISRFSKNYLVALGIREVDVYGICNSTSILLLQKGRWNKIHVTTQKSANVGEFSRIKRNAHCPFGKDVHCIIIEIQQEPSLLHKRGSFASVNCISGKFPNFLKKHTSGSPWHNN